MIQMMLIVVLSIMLSAVQPMKLTHEAYLKLGTDQKLRLRAQIDQAIQEYLMQREAETQKNTLEFVN